MSGSVRKGLVSRLVGTLLTVGALATAVHASEEAGQQAPKPGLYCPGQDTLYLILEELTAALHGVTRARESLLDLNDPATAAILLARAGDALALAAGRGSGARVAMLIDAAMAAKQDGRPKAMLPWLPMLKLALSALPPDDTRAAATAQVATAEAIIQGAAAGDEIQTLVNARQLLVCDPLDIPVRQSLALLLRMQRDVARGASPSGNDFSALIDLLNRAMTDGLQRLVALQGA